MKERAPSLGWRGGAARLAGGVRARLAACAWWVVDACASRLSRATLCAVACTLLAFVLNEVDRLPDTLDWIAAHGTGGFAVYWLSNQALPALVIAAAILLALKLGARDARTLASQPLRFAALLAAGAAAGVLCAWALELACGWMPSPRSPAFDWTTLYEAWTTALLWGGLAGWLYVLLRRREEDAGLFALMLARRSLVASQLAHAQLAAARAQVDPALLMDTLREVRARYRAPDDMGHQGAIELMDGLVHALRLAIDSDAHEDADGSSPRRRTRAWIELIALRGGLALRREPGAAGDVLALSGDGLTPDVVATLADWARRQPGILRHGLEAGPPSSYVIHVSA